MNEDVLVYGAYGHTGRFTVRELLRRGLTPVLAGRDAARLGALTAQFPGLETRAAGTGRVGEVIGSAAVVVNCAGPFLDTAVPVARAGAHYLDVSAEQASVQAVYGAAGRGGDVAVVPGMAFYGGLADLMATAAAGGDGQRPDEVTVVYGVDRWWPTEGTRTTGRRNTAARLVVEQGALAPAAGCDFPLASWDFPGALGEAAVTGCPFCEVIQIDRHLGASRVRSYLTSGALRDLADPATGAPAAAGADGRSAQRFEVDVVVQPGPAAPQRRLSVAGQDIYAFTGSLVAQAALWLARGQARARGAAAPGEVFAAAEFLHGFSPRELTVRRPRGPAEPVRAEVS